jgi:ATP-dependent protease ClpP protease subunit
MLSGTLTATNTSEATLSLMYFDGISDEPVTLMLNADGGSVDDAAALVDTLSLMRAPVTVEVRGRAHGAAGVVIASAPGERKIGSVASISLRLDRTQLPPGATTAAALTKAAERDAEVRRQFAIAVGQRSANTIEWVLEQFDRGVMFGVAEALANGLVDTVG